MISSRTVLSPSTVVPWAGERGERRQSAEALGQSLPERGKRLGIERPPFVVVQGKKYLEQVHWRHFLQNRSIPNMKSSATVMRAEISREPKQPRRFEKKKNISGPEGRMHANQPNPTSVPECGSRSRPRQPSRSVPVGAAPGARGVFRPCEGIDRSPSAKSVRLSCGSARAPPSAHRIADPGPAARCHHWRFRRELSRSCRSTNLAWRCSR